MNEGDAEQLGKRILGAVERSRRVPAPDDEAMRVEATEAAGTRLTQVAARAAWSITPTPYLDRIEQQFVAVAGALESYVDTEGHDEQPWPIGWDEVQGMWDALLPLVVVAPPTGETAEEVADFRKRAGQLTRRLTEDVEKARAELDTLRDSLQSIEAERDSAIAALKEQQAGVQATITEQTNRLEQSLRDLQAQFTDAEQRRENSAHAAITEERGKFEAALKEDRAELHSFIEKVGASVSEAIDKAETASTEALARIEEIERKATKSYNAVGNAGFAGMFQRDANSERNQAGFWRVVAVLTFAGLAGAGVAEGRRAGQLQHRGRARAAPGRRRFGVARRVRDQPGASPSRC